MNRKSRRKSGKSLNESSVAKLRAAVEAAYREQAAGNLGKAEMMYRRTLKSFSDQPFAMHLLGIVYYHRGKHEDAVAILEDTLRLKPDFAEAQNTLGTFHMELGRLDAARDCFRAAIRANPRYAEAHRHLSLVKRHSEPDVEMSQMQALFDTPGIDDNARMHLAFGLGKAHEDTGNFAKAFDCFSTANALRRKMLTYDEDAYLAALGRVTSIFTPEFLAERQDAGIADATPAFIVGMPRAGSSLIEQTLSGHPDAFGAGELDDLQKVLFDTFGNLLGPEAATTVPAATPAAWRRAAKAYLAELKRHAPGAALISDKMPENFRWIGFIRVMFPNARVIHCRRNPMDTCLSIFKNYFPQPGLEYSFDLAELGAYYRAYRKMMAHWHDLLPGYIHDAVYEDVVADHRGQTEAMLRYCGLDWDPGCLDLKGNRRAIKTASAGQVRQGIFTDSVAAWKHYENELAPLSAALGPEIV
jgi:tetratricopeptide (TPR) repeat protein